MKGYLTLFFLITSCIKIFSQNPFSVSSKPDKNFIQSISEEESKRYKARFRAVESLTGLNYDLKYHRLVLEINPDTLYIKGSVTSYFKIIENNVSSVSFDLSS